MKKIIFWDWTGTLADESKLDWAVCRSMEQGIAKKENISTTEAEKIFKEYLKKLENRWEWHDYVLHGKNLGIDWKAPQERNLSKLIQLPYTKDALSYAKSKEYKNILTTNAVRDVILMRINYAGLQGLFDAIVASDDVQGLKSEGKHFEYGLKIEDGDSRLSFSIGNNPVQDILPAKRLGLKTILCDFGKNLTHYHSQHISHQYEKSAEADFLIKNLLEIKHII
jgi:FMN phosphatase YigB (HAD superfamily)